MGQRLVINIMGDEFEPLMNCYFHWDAYTMSSIDDIDKFISAWEDMWDEMPVTALKETSSFKDFVCLAMMRAWCGAKPSCDEDFKGLDSKKDDVLSMYKLKLIGEGMYRSAEKAFADGDEYEKIMNRNDGLIGFTEASIENNEKYAEFLCSIRIDQITGKITEICFGVLNIEDEATTKDWYCESESDEEFEKKIFRTEEDISYITSGDPILRKDWDKFVALMGEASDKDCYFIGEEKKEGTTASDRSVIEIVA